MFTKLPLLKRSSFLQRFFKPVIYPEAYFAYFRKLPNEININWFRDDGMIIGKVTAGNKEFMTQGVDADDFVRMVNQSIVTAFDIPDDYFDVINQTKSYAPTTEQKRLMEDRNVAGDNIGLEKNELELKVA